jgi:hypothetical protein
MGRQLNQAAAMLETLVKQIPKGSTDPEAVAMRGLLKELKDAAMKTGRGGNWGQVMLRTGLSEARVTALLEATIARTGPIGKAVMTGGSPAGALLKTAGTVAALTAGQMGLSMLVNRPEIQHYANEPNPESIGQNFASVGMNNLAIAWTWLASASERSFTRPMAPIGHSLWSGFNYKMWELTRDPAYLRNSAEAASHIDDFFTENDPDDPKNWLVSEEAWATIDERARLRDEALQRVLELQPRNDDEWAARWTMMELTAMANIVRSWGEDTVGTVNYTKGWLTGRSEYSEAARGNRARAQEMLDYADSLLAQGDREFKPWWDQQVYDDLGLCNPLGFLGYRTDAICAEPQPAPPAPEAPGASPTATPTATPTAEPPVTAPPAATDPAAPVQPTQPPVQPTPSTDPNQPPVAAPTATPPQPVPPTATPPAPWAGDDSGTGAPVADAGAQPPAPVAQAPAEAPVSSVLGAAPAVQGHLAGMVRDTGTEAHQRDIRPEVRHRVHRAQPLHVLWGLALRYLGPEATDAEIAELVVKIWEANRAALGDDLERLRAGVELEVPPVGGSTPAPVAEAPDPGATLPTFRRATPSNRPLKALVDAADLLWGIAAMALPEGARTDDAIQAYGQALWTANAAALGGDPARLVPGVDLVEPPPVR